MSSRASVPEGMREVSKDAFFAALAQDSRDIMPNHGSPDFTAWQVVATRQRWGWSLPGWKNPMGPKVWAVADATR